MTKLLLKDLIHQVIEAKGALRYQLDRLDRFTNLLNFFLYGYL